MTAVFSVYFDPFLLKLELQTFVLGKAAIKTCPEFCLQCLSGNLVIIIIIIAGLLRFHDVFKLENISSDFYLKRWIILFCFALKVQLFHINSSRRKV